MQYTNPVPKWLSSTVDAARMRADAVLSYFLAVLYCVSGRLGSGTLSLQSYGKNFFPYFPMFDHDTSNLLQITIMAILINIMGKRILSFKNTIL